MRLVTVLLALVLLPVLPSRASSIVEFNISGVGKLVVELYDRDKPVTVSNFLKYVTSGVWSNMILHRATNDFVVQGGGIAITNRFTNPQFVSAPNFGMITNEYDVGRMISNDYGTIVMAKIDPSQPGGGPDTASSQWFFNLADNGLRDPHYLDLDNGGFTVFGRVISDTNILNKMNLALTNSVIGTLDLGGVLSETPYLLSTNPTVSYNDLLYTQVRLLQLDMAMQARVLPSGAQEISWNSFSNRPNIIEYVTNVAATNWQPLATNLGNGQRMALTNSTPDTNRFYRVRFTY